MFAFVFLMFLGVLLLAVTAAQHRRHTRETDRRLCAFCGTDHPIAARFCRRCGHQLG